MWKANAEPYPWKYEQDIIEHKKENRRGENLLKSYENLNK
jgi:hypothetical protein